MALRVGEAATIVAIGTWLAVGVSLACGWFLHQRVWWQGERIPAEVDLPLTQLALLWGLSLIVLVLGSIVTAPGGGRRAAMPIAWEQATATRALREWATSLARSSSGRAGAAGVVTAAALITMAFSLAISTQTMRAGDSRTIFQPGQSWVSLDPGQTVTAELLADLSLVTGSPVAVGYRPMPSNATNQGISFRISTPSGPLDGTGFRILQNDRDFEWLTGRAMADQERVVLASGGAVLLADYVPPGTATLDVTKFDLNSEAAVVVLKNVPTLTTSPSETTRVQSGAAVGPQFMQRLAANGIDAISSPELIMTAPGSPSDSVTLAKLRNVLAEHGVPPDQLRSQKAAADAIGDGGRTILVIIAAAGLATVALATAAATILGSTWDRVLRRMGASGLTRFRLNVVIPAQVQTVRATAGASAGLLLAAVMHVPLGLRVGVEPLPALYVIAFAILAAGVSASLAWSLVRNRETSG